MKIFGLVIRTARHYRSDLGDSFDVGLAVARIEARTGAETIRPRSRTGRPGGHLRLVSDSTRATEPVKPAKRPHDVA